MFWVNFNFLCASYLRSSRALSPVRPLMHMYRMSEWPLNDRFSNNSCCISVDGWIEIELL